MLDSHQLNVFITAAETSKFHASCPSSADEPAQRQPAHSDPGKTAWIVRYSIVWVELLS